MYIFITDICLVLFYYFEIFLTIYKKVKVYKKHTKAEICAFVCFLMPDYVKNQNMRKNKYKFP